MCTTCLLLVFAEAFINVLGGALTLAIFVRIARSWIPTLPLPWGLGPFCWGVSEPILAPIRRLMPPAAGFDLSPMIAVIAIQFAQSILLRLLPQAV